jgi:hypothetical protein
VQSVLVTQDAPEKEPLEAAPVGLGVDWIVHAWPFQFSTNAATLFGVLS